MYEKFFGLRELPFELTPNPDYLVFTRGHREALSNLQYGLSSAKTLTVLIGEPGTGKTTLIRAATASERCRGVDVVHLTNPALTRDEFIELLARRFDLSTRAATSKAALLGELEAVLIGRRVRGQITALVVDEAQSLSADLLEEVRLLANIETGTEKLLPLVLSGQPRLRDRLNEPGLAQLKQRVTLRCEVHPLTVEETASYIARRVEQAGGDARRLFTREAVVLLHQQSRGIPRVISVICDNALITGFASGRQPVDAATIRDVLRDFDLDARSHYATEELAVDRHALSEAAAAAAASETGQSVGSEPRRSEAATGRGGFPQPAVGKARASGG
jgi:type II secretory pathway predicted ATPase ExeA